MMGEPTEWQSGMEGKRELSRLRSILANQEVKRSEPQSPFSRENKIHVGFLASSDRLFDLRLAVVNRRRRVIAIVLLLVVDARDEQNLSMSGIGWKVHEDH